MFYTGPYSLGVSLLVVAVERGHVPLEVLLQLVERSHGLIKRPGGTQAWRRSGGQGNVSPDQLEVALHLFVILLHLFIC